MVPLFWKYKYSELCGELSKIVSVDKDGDLILDNCVDLEPSSSKLLMMVKIDTHLVVSPGRATFGGVWARMVGELDSELMRSFYQKFLKKFGSSTINLHLPPGYFHPEIFGIQHKIILDEGGQVLYSDTSFHIDLMSWTPMSMSKGNRKKLRQCREQFVHTTLLSSKEIEIVYELIRVNRQSLGVDPSISLDALERAFETFPEIYQCFGTFMGEKLIAAAVTVLLSEDIRYVYMWADDADHRSISPVVALCEGIINDSMKIGLRIVDLGTASLQGELDEGLARFKQNLGAISTQKISYTF